MGSKASVLAAPAHRQSSSRLRVIPALVGLSCLSLIGAFLLRFELGLPEQTSDIFYALPLAAALRLLAFSAFRLDRCRPRYADIADLIWAGAANTAASVAFAFVVRAGIPDWGFSRSVILIDWILFQVLVSAYYVAPRLSRRARTLAASGRRRAVVVGDGEALELVLADMQNSARFAPVAVLTNSVAGSGDKVRGVTVTGTPEHLDETLRRLRPAAVCFVSPGIAPAELLRMTRICRQQQIDFVVLRSRQSLAMPGRQEAPDLAVEVLLQREEVSIDLDAVRRMIEGRRVLVTGAGGSIGSELSRQIARFRPAALYLVERSENSLFFIHRELSSANPELTVHPLLLDIRDEAALNAEFDRALPEIVFHAAAHKHVGMMQRWPLEAIRNNVIGTWNVARAALRVGAGRFVNISTDKAVRPQSFMGFSKRLAEICTQELNRHGITEYVNVRFGNVAGSAGSVIQLFRQQIEAGGPVTVTDPRARRYFMSIPEAVRLVLQAAVFSQTRGLFMLDMREPIEIHELARTMISLAGYLPGEDIPIEFTRLGPGEKLSEELCEDCEQVVPTPHDRVWRLQREGDANSGMAARIASWRRMLDEGNSQRVLEEANEVWRHLKDQPERQEQLAGAGGGK